MDEPEDESESTDDEIPMFEGQVVFKGDFDKSLEPTPLSEHIEDE